MENWITIQGDSTDIKNITVKGVTDYTNYTGHVLVLEDKNNTTRLEIPTIIPDVLNGFTIGLSPGHTESLPVGSYIVVVQITKTENDVPTYRREIKWNLQVTKQLVR